VRCGLEVFQLGPTPVAINNHGHVARQLLAL